MENVDIENLRILMNIKVEANTCGRITRGAIALAITKRRNKYILII